MHPIVDEILSLQAKTLAGLVVQGLAWFVPSDRRLFLAISSISGENRYWCSRHAWSRRVLSLVSTSPHRDAAELGNGADELHGSPAAWAWDHLGVVAIHKDITSNGWSIGFESHDDSRPVQAGGRFFVPWRGSGRLGCCSRATAYVSLINAVFLHSVHSNSRTRLINGSAITVMNFIGVAQATQGGDSGLSSPVGELAGSFMFL
jgi:hypothetical protein